MKNKIKKRIVIMVIIVILVVFGAILGTAETLSDSDIDIHTIKQNEN